MSPLGISLFVTACLHGTLHGAPKDLCHEFQIRSFADVMICTEQAPAAAAEWLKGLRLVGIAAFIPTAGGWRCAPRVAEGWEP